MWGTPRSIRNHTTRRRFIPTHVGNTSMSISNPTLNAVHPHACGEHFFEGHFEFSLFGSSPRMWGTPRSIRNHTTRRRFIPTHVGNTQDDLDWESLEPVHPHACGEHVSAVEAASSPTGSSPRMWGTPSTLSCAKCGVRFIPTHVGNTRGAAGSSSIRTVHPHACGEHFVQWVTW